MTLRQGWQQLRLLNVTCAHAHTQTHALQSGAQSTLESLAPRAYPCVCSPQCAAQTLKTLAEWMQERCLLLRESVGGPSALPAETLLSVQPSGNQRPPFWSPQAAVRNKEALHQSLPALRAEIALALHESQRESQTQVACFTRSVWPGCQCQRSRVLGCGGDGQSVSWPQMQNHHRMHWEPEKGINRNKTSQRSKVKQKNQQKPPYLQIKETSYMILSTNTKIALFYSNAFSWCKTVKKLRIQLPQPLKEHNKKTCGQFILMAQHRKLCLQTMDEARPSSPKTVRQVLTSRIKSKKIEGSKGERRSRPPPSKKC